MKTVKTCLKSFSLKYPLEHLAPLDQILFLDIETTGFSSASSYLYLIGCTFRENDTWKTIQWFAEKYEEEPVILTAFFEFAAAYRYLLHFNGTTFDIPFIQHKCARHKLSFTFDKMESIDLYKKISPCKYLLKLPNCKQKTLEQFLEIPRDDIYDGGDLIGLYHEYVKAPSSMTEKKILLHNQEDLQGMLEILPVLSYYDLFTKDVTARKVQAYYYRDLSGQKRMELLMTLSLPVSLPKLVSISGNGCYFMGESDSGSLKVPVYEEEMKYFYSNYKDYYYLPTEDVALHKSVASFVDSEHRIPATAATCYTRKQSQYLPQWGLLREPFFKRDYKSKEMFFELTDELKRDRAAFTAYANHLLAMLATVY